MKKLAQYAKSYQKQIILGPIFKLLEAICELTLPYFMGKLVDEGISKNNPTQIYYYAIIIFGLSLFGLICVLICQYFASIASQGFGTNLRNAVLKKINSFGFDEINRFGTDTLITRITSDVNQLQLALAMLIRLVIRAPFLGIGSIIMAFVINWQIATIFVITLPIFCALLAFIMIKSVPLYQYVQTLLDKLNLQITENLTGVRVIRAFANKKSSINKVNQTTDELAKAYKHVANISAFMNPGTTLIMNLGIVAILKLGGLYINSGVLTTGDVVALINYMSQMLLALIVIANLVIIFTKAGASAKRVNEILSTPIKEDYGLDVPINPIKNTLSLDHIAYRYTQDSGDAISNISFEITTGQTLGIIGPTGSGKSTLIQVIPAFLEYTAGDILFNKQPITSFSKKAWQNLFGIVPQHSVLFSGTIRSNLLWGKQNATDDECWQALKLAQAEDFVRKLPQQLDTPVQARGKNFSGGQRQRLTIARALIKQPSILILDDSLSALDYQTDFDLRKALQTNLPKTIKIIISQRVSSVKNAEKILVLSDGLVKGLGTHEELLSTSLTYQEIYLSQEGGHNNAE